MSLVVIHIRIELTVNVKLKDTTINIPLEDYVTGVVAAEMPALFLEEALKNGKNEDIYNADKLEVNEDE